MNQWGVDDLDGMLRLVSSIYTFISFIVALLLLPCGLLTYCVVRLTQGAFLGLLERRYSHLEFVRTTSLRTAIDTHRNQGVISMLLRVRGACDLQRVRDKLQENVVERLTACGSSTRYPHMKTALTTRWGRYAWYMPEQGFRVENHVTLGSSVFRGRPITEQNIQEYVSDVISKYLTPELSPWQLTVIPMDEHFYLLARIHHLLLSEDRVGLGDLLLLQEVQAERATLCEDEENFQLPDEEYEPLIELGRPLEALPMICSGVLHWLVDTWTSCKQHVRQPRLVLKLPATCLLALPGRVMREVVALCTSPAQHPGTLIEWGHRYQGLVLQAVREACSYWSVLYTGPRVLLEELIISHQMPRHQLQTVSLCGRKVVAWSEPVPLNTVRGIRHVTDATQSEIFMSATAGALRHYFQQFNLRVPDTVLATARFFPLRTLLATSSTFEAGISPSTGGGSLCLALPTVQGGDKDGLLATSELLKQTRTRQPILYLTSLWQLEKGLMTKILPTVVVRLVLNYLTRRYAVSVTEVASDHGHPAKRQLLWGQQVDSVMYWRPPQANICMSLTIITYGDCVRMGVMSDALLSPHHTTLVTGFMRQIHALSQQHAALDDTR